MAFIRMITKLLFSVLIIVLIIDSHECQKTSCDKQVKPINKLIRDYFLFGSQDRKFPTNPSTMKKYCLEGTKIHTTIQNYSETCLKDLSKKVINLFIYSVGKHSQSTCKSRRRSAEFIVMGDCANAAKKRLVKCFDNLLINLDVIKVLPDHKIKIPQACCVAFKMKSCIVSSVEKSPDVCKQKAVDGLENLFGAYLTDVMQLMCGDYTEDSDKCEQIAPRLPKSKSNAVSGSIISIFTELIQGLPEN